ncbi:hypothetical protein PIB30_055853 [Stylosanthes scabra]|uniref:At2g35280-like TPR domain-containing protein n=1 Tax=Stylosanthes scabra TaxID=79078 RepID=A0ABU6RJN1_9FABA|nr:hypothetical protein [Stylosanthes scabra]
MGVNPDVKVLSEEVWVHLATMVAKESFSDLLNMKQANKFFCSVAESDEVYKHARLVKLPPFAYLRFIDRSERRMIKRCLKSGKPEAVFLKGYQQYFTVGDEEVGLELLSAAALNGHVYALEDLRKCRQRIRRLLGRVWWVENRPSTPEHPDAQPCQGRG